MISLCMIIKDDSELDLLKRAVDSCVKYVDEVVITATNKPCKKIESYCKDNKFNYSYFQWVNDFSAARNFNFSQAKYDQFWLDTDDVVIGAKNLPDMAEVLDKGEIDWISLPYLYDKDEFGRIRARQVKPRLTRKGTGKWNKSVHECYEPTKAINHFEDDTVIIDHLKGEGHDQSSSERNLTILLKEYKKDGDKTDARTLMYIGNTFAVMEKWDEALSFYVLFIDRSGWDEDKYFALHSMIDCFYSKGEYDGMVESAFQMIKLFPQWSLGYFDLARGYSLKNDHKKVVEWTLAGLKKEKPKTMNFTNDLDYTVMPLGRLADAYLQVGRFNEALKIAELLSEQNPKDPMVKELLQTCEDIMVKENFVKSFLNVSNMIRREDRLKAIKLFECLPTTLDSDIRIQNIRSAIVPPKNWDEKSIVIYCAKGNGETWAYPSIFTGIGGSEEAVINMSQELTKLGYKVTVYNNCGEMTGEYDGVDYIPFYHFNPKDNFNVLIGWRVPQMFNFDIKAKQKIVWLHDIAYEWQFNDKIIKNTDKFVFLSRWHRNNMPSIPEEKCYISNNGINPKHFETVGEKKPNSLFWGSSYDRGLLPFLKNIFPLIQKEIPEVTLDVCYGWQNIDREIDLVPGLRQLREELTPLLEGKGITHHGRVSHKKVAELMKQSMVYPYASEFGETNNITSQKAQCASCYVITTSQAGGTPERVKFGEVLQGNNIYTDPKLQKEFAKTVVNYLRQPHDYKNALGSIVEAFSWETTAKHWKDGLLCD